VEKSQGGIMVDINLRKMTAADAIRQAVIISGKTQEVIEEEAGLRPGSLDQYQSRRDPHWPNMLHMPALSMALGTDLLLRWQDEQYLAKCLRYDAPSMCGRELLGAVVKLAAEIGDVATAAQAALSNDGEIDRAEAMAIRREAMEAVATLWKIMNGVSGRV
jgi:hypothetical protein